MTTLVKDVFAASDEIKGNRTLQDILTHLVTEVGELAQEIQIAEVKSYKEHGKDGVVGEAVDVISCVLDIVKVYNPTITEDDMIHILQPKIQKWKDTAAN